MSFLSDLVESISGEVSELPGVELLGFQARLFGLPEPSLFGGNIDLPGIGADTPSQTGSFRDNTQLQLISDQGFARTSTSPQSVVPIIFGTYRVNGTLIEYFLLGENNKRMFAVIGVSQAPIVKVKVFLDDKDVETLPGFIDVDGGATPDDNKSWVNFYGNGGLSNEFVLANSRKKNVNAGARAGEIVTSTLFYFFNTVPGNNEARAFLTVDVPDIYVDNITSVDADYSGLNGKTLLIDSVAVGNIDTNQINVVMTASEIDATTVALRINVIAGGQVTATVVNVDEIKIESDNPDNKRLELSGDAFAQLGMIAQNHGTEVSWTLSIQKKGSTSTIEIASETDAAKSKIVNGQPQKTNILLDDSGDFYFDASIPEVGFWTFILDVEKATNGAKVSIFMVEIMNDFVITENGDFSGIAGQTLIMDVNGIQQSIIIFDGGTNTAALAVIDINDQLGAFVTATLSGSQVQIEAIPGPVGTESVTEIKEIQITGGTAASAMNFKPLYAETVTYNIPGKGFVIGNFIKTGAISGNPNLSFEITGPVNNPAQSILSIFEQPSDINTYGLDIGHTVDRDSFQRSIDFDTDNNFTANTAGLGVGRGGLIESLMQSGSLLMVKNAGRYKLVPETDSDPIVTLNQTDDLESSDISRDSMRWSFVDETLKFNVLRVNFPDADENYVMQELIIDVTGLVDTGSGVEPRIYEDGSLINISDSNKDFRRDRAISMPAVTSRSQAFRLGNQFFKKTNLVNLNLQIDVSIIHYYLEKWDIVNIISDELGFVEKPFRIIKIQENLSNDNFGFSLSLQEHFAEIYQ